jgi:hypothetical protein
MWSSSWSGEPLAWLAALAATPHTSALHISAVGDKPADQGTVCGCVGGAQSWKYVYVENLTWVQMTPANRFLRVPYSKFSTSHRTLLIFRRIVPEGKAIELRHQRTPDVIVDYVPSTHGGRPPLSVSLLCSLGCKSVCMASVYRSYSSPWCGLFCTASHRSAPVCSPCHPPVLFC